jgi:hypothetical protein
MHRAKTEKPRKVTAKTTLEDQEGVAVSRAGHQGLDLRKGRRGRRGEGGGRRGGEEQ